MAKKILYLLLVVFIIIQFFAPAKNMADAAGGNDISTRFAVPGDVKNILENACNDCHSNNTRYPWYFSIQPVGWWLNYHIKKGKAELNFNEFARYQLRRQYHKMEEVEKQVKENEMPLSSYTLLHQNAKLSDQQKKTLVSWSRAVRDTLEANYPIDSLKRK